MTFSTSTQLFLSPLMIDYGRKHFTQQSSTLQNRYQEKQYITIFLVEYLTMYIIYIGIYILVC